MVRLITLRPAWLLKNILRFMVLDYGDTFSPVAKIAFVCLLLSMAAMCSWPLYQFDIKMSSFMVILQRKCIWSNHLVLLLKESLV